MCSKFYSPAKREIVSEWTGNWLSLLLLINEVTGTLEPPATTDEIQYQLLRSWLIEHEDEITPLWKDFRTSPDYDSYKNQEVEHTVDAEGIEPRELGEPSCRVCDMDCSGQLAKFWDTLCRYEQRPKLFDIVAEDTADLPGLSRYLENPFSFFYETPGLYEIAYHLGLQTRRDIWEPSEYWAGRIRPVLVSFCAILVGFDRWIRDRTYDL